MRGVSMWATGVHLDTQTDREKNTS